MGTQTVLIKEAESRMESIGVKLSWSNRHTLGAVR